MPRNDEEEQDVALAALNAIDGCMSTLLMARTIIVDRLEKFPKRNKPDPTSTMGSKPVDCPHVNTQDKDLMGGVVLTWCRDCGEQL